MRRAYVQMLLMSISDIHQTFPMPIRIRTSAVLSLSLAPVLYLTQHKKTKIFPCQLSTARLFFPRIQCSRLIKEETVINNAQEMCDGLLSLSLFLFSSTFMLISSKERKETVAMLRLDRFGKRIVFELILIKRSNTLLEMIYLDF